METLTVTIRKKDMLAHLLVYRKAVTLENRFTVVNLTWFFLHGAYLRCFFFLHVHLTKSYLLTSSVIYCYFYLFIQAFS